MEQRMSATPESEGFAIRLLREIAGDVKELRKEVHRTLWGYNSHVGLVAKVERNEERLDELFDDKAARRKMRIHSDGTAESKWKAWLIWGGVVAAFIGLLGDILAALTGS